MPLPKKLDCPQVYDIVGKFFSGYSVNSLATHFGVSRLTITRLLERRTYKECKHLNLMVDAIGKVDYLAKIDTQMLANRRTGRGNRKDIS